MHKKMLEVIAISAKDAVAAEQGGADRIELVTGIAEGGLSPSLGLVESVVHAVAIPVNVMVRPHSQSFCYDSLDIRTMLADIRHIRQSGAAGIVIGTLKAGGRVIDTKTLSMLLEEAGDMDVTFHRAFDELEDQGEGLRVLSQYKQIRRILTSGGKAPAVQASPSLQRLVKQAYTTHLSIMAGHGLTLENLGEIVKSTGVSEVHFGSAVRCDASFSQPVDTERVAQVRLTLAGLQ